MTMAIPTDQSPERVVFVTGGASGIGRAGALAFAETGAAVMVADINELGARETVEIILAGGGLAASVVCDVTDEPSITTAIDATVARFGGLHVAFNNAGNALGQDKVHLTDAAAWRAGLEINLTSVFLCAKHQLVHMIDHGGGVLVNTSSGAARVPAPGRPAYSAAKRGVIALTAHIARDYAAQGVRANAILPGLIDTPAVRSNHDEESLAAMAAFLPGRRLGTPAEVADVAVWLASHESRHVNGQAIVVDGGGIHA